MGVRFRLSNRSKLTFKMVQKVNSADEFNAVVSKGGLVCVDFFATWCGPCRMIAPYLEELAKEFEGKCTFLKVDVDELEDLAAEQEVKAMPTFSFSRMVKELTPLLVPIRIKLKLL